MIARRMTQTGTTTPAMMGTWLLEPEAAKTIVPVDGDA
jgi:hypothetical protein